MVSVAQQFSFPKGRLGIKMSLSTVLHLGFSPSFQLQPQECSLLAQLWAMLITVSVWVTPFFPWQDTLDLHAREGEFKSILLPLCNFHTCVPGRVKFGLGAGMEGTWWISTWDLCLCHCPQQQLRGPRKGKKGPGNHTWR